MLCVVCYIVTKVINSKSIVFINNILCCLWPFFAFSLSLFLFWYFANVFNNLSHCGHAIWTNMSSPGSIRITFVGHFCFLRFFEIFANSLRIKLWWECARIGRYFRPLCFCDFKIHFSPWIPHHFQMTEWTDFAKNNLWSMFVHVFIVHTNETPDLRQTNRGCFYYFFVFSLVRQFFYVVSNSWAENTCTHRHTTATVSNVNTH